jgi:excisionase family DNA binding protein
MSRGMGDVAPEVSASRSPRIPSRPLASPSRDTASASTLPLLLTVAEAAGLLRTSRKAIYTMIERGLIGGITRIGKRVLFHREDLLDWISERRAASPERTRR